MPRLQKSMGRQFCAMTPERLAEIHANAFDGLGRAWSADEFKTLLESPLTHVVGDERAFVLGQVTSPDAEVLTVACRLDCQRMGLSLENLERFNLIARGLGAERVFLEVSERNKGALALYHKADFKQLARRKGYYAAPEGYRCDALVLELQLSNDN